MPPLNHAESLEVTRIHSALRHDTLFNQLVTVRPFRSPHHSSSAIALVGGGFTPIPGEITLAHHGVLFLDEFPEFSRHTLESLRQPLEDGYVNIARIKKQCHFPARFMLVAAMNPCPCGYKTDKTKICKCSPTVIERYQQRISGPLLDRIDIHAHVPALSPTELTDTPTGENSATIIKRVVNARQRQVDRFKHDAINCNAHMPARLIQQYCQLNKATLQLLNNATKTLGLSARSYERLLKVARTIADLDNSDVIKEEHVAESISYRSFDTLK